MKKYIHSSLKLGKWTELQEYYEHIEQNFKKRRGGGQKLIFRFSLYSTSLVSMFPGQILDD